MAKIETFHQYIRALTQQEIDKDKDSGRKGAGAESSSQETYLGEIQTQSTVPNNPIEPTSEERAAGVVTPPTSDNLNPVIGIPSHSEDQVTSQPISELITPLDSQISIQQTLILPSLSSDVASVSVDIFIDGSAEKYEINWVTA